jgi:hypothetical protein
MKFALIRVHARFPAWIALHSLHFTDLTDDDGAVFVWRGVGNGQMIKSERHTALGVQTITSQYDRPM